MTTLAERLDPYTMLPKRHGRYRRGWHLIYNLDGSFRGYEWALDENGEWQTSRVYAQENRDEFGKPLSAR